jgi:hypothetical protein
MFFVFANLDLVSIFWGIYPIWFCCHPCVEGKLPLPPAATATARAATHIKVAMQRLRKQATSINVRAS